MVDTASEIQILDFGCGGGQMTLAVAEGFPGASVTGVDIDSEVLQEPRQIADDKKISNVTFRTVGETDLLDTLGGTFDIIIMSDVLHDLYNPMSVLNEVKSVLRPDGYLVTFDPPFYSDHSLNAGDFSAASRYLVSMFVCLPHSLSGPPAVGFGMGWGYENKIKFLKEQGFERVKIKENEDISKAKRRVLVQKSSPL